jgi:hypothetical protein
MDWLIAKLFFMAAVGGWFGWFLRSFDVEAEKKEHEKTKSKLDKMAEKHKQRGIQINEMSKQISMQKRYTQTLDKHAMKALGELKQAQHEGREVSAYAIKRELKIINRRFLND